MRRTMWALLCAGLLLGTVSCATGRGDYGEWRSGIYNRIHAAEARIDRGVQRGTLTRYEGDRLHGELNGIRAKVERMREGGGPDALDRDNVNHDLDRLDRDIAREKRDNESR